jgi:hypothetical protein
LLPTEMQGLWQDLGLGGERKTNVSALDSPFAAIIIVMI